MEYKDSKLTKIDLFEFVKENFYIMENVLIENCIINDLIIPYQFEGSVIIRSSLITNLNAHGGYFKKGVTISNCIFENLITFEAGGHNDLGEIDISNNIFNCFVDFFDAHFTNKFIFTNNILTKGSNLLGNAGLPIETLFRGIPEIENNLGELTFRDI